jgi:hypothetical protein
MPIFSWTPYWGALNHSYVKEQVLQMRGSFRLKYITTAELSYNVMKGTEYFVSL